MLCPKPAAAQKCGVKANGYSDYFISVNYVTPEECNQLCLSTPSCKSFQNVPNQVPNGLGLKALNYCNLWNANVDTVADKYPSGSQATFYDRDCPDLLPVSVNFFITHVSIPYSSHKAGFNANTRIGGMFSSPSRNRSRKSTNHNRAISR